MHKTKSYLVLGEQNHPLGIDISQILIKLGQNLLMSALVFLQLKNESNETGPTKYMLTDTSLPAYAEGYIYTLMYVATWNQPIEEIAINK